MSASSQAPRTLAQRIRRVMVWVIVVSFALAAVCGIVVLLSGQLGDTASKVLITTALVGLFSIAVLCCLSLVGRRLQFFGFLGAAISIVTLLLCLVMLWSSDSVFNDNYYKWIWMGVSATVAFALASLLLLLADRQRSAVRIGLGITLGLFAVVLLMVWYLVWWYDTVDDQVFPRLLGIASILAALGAVVVPVLSLLLRDAPAAGAHGPALANGQLAPELAGLLIAEASRRGISVEALVAPVLAAPAVAAAPQSDSSGA